MVPDLSERLLYKGQERDHGYEPQDFFLAPEGGALWPAQLLKVSQELVVLPEGPCAFTWGGGKEKPSGLDEALSWSQRGHRW